jgi:hypothetical protein
MGSGAAGAVNRPVGYNCEMIQSERKVHLQYASADTRFSAPTWYRRLLMLELVLGLLIIFGLIISSF